MTGSLETVKAGLREWRGHLVGVSQTVHCHRPTWPPLDCHMNIHRTNQSQTSSFLQFLPLSFRNPEERKINGHFFFIGNTSNSGVFHYPLVFHFSVLILNQACFHFTYARKSPCHLIFSAFDNEFGASVLSRSLMVAIICYFRVLDHCRTGSWRGSSLWKTLYHS